MPSMEIVVTSCVPKKSGEKNGRKWTLYEVHADTKQGGQVFSTFDSGWAHQTGRMLTVDYTIKQNGKFTDFTLGDAPTAAPNGAAATGTSAAVPAPGDKFDRLVAKLDAIYEQETAILAMLRAHFK